jgi:hypothetical protein
MLLFYYQPTVSDAHASVEFITDHVPGGALVRNIHAWASSMMIASVSSIRRRSHEGAIGPASSPGSPGCSCSASR